MRHVLRAPSATLPLAIMMLALLWGCQDDRAVRLDEVTPEARTTIAKIAGKDSIAGIREERPGGRRQYRVRIARDGEMKDYTVDDAGIMRD